MRVTIMDYGVGNLHSISKGFERAGADVEIVADPRALLDAECIVFPGVGAFGAAMEILRPVLLDLQRRIAQGVPTFGVCLGMQILFEKSEESLGPGLGVIKGEVKRLRSGRIPQMGWNNVIGRDEVLFRGIQKGSQFYFANSYVSHPSEEVAIAWTEYGERFPSAVRKGPLCGVQFHPEKSGPAGLMLISNFVELAEGSS